MLYARYVEEIGEVNTNRSDRWLFAAIFFLSLSRF